MSILKVSLGQLNTQDNLEENLNTIKNMVKEASENGSQLISFPEYSTYIGKNPKSVAEDIKEGTQSKFFSKLSKENKIAIHVGSIYEANKEEPKFYNTSLFYNENGELISTYRKIHLFDVDIENGPKILESKRISSGKNIVTTKLNNLATFGLSICYDLRFPELYRLLAIEGAEILLIPTNFTKETGDAHLETLLRARAIENGCYVLSAAQCGQKPNFLAHGQSLIIDPWGNVVSSIKDSTGIITAEIDLENVKKARNQIGIFANRREDIYKLNIV